MVETLLESGSSSLVLQFLREEYATMYALATYPKPVVAIADGYTMGAVSSSLP